MTEVLDNIDCVPSNVQSSHQEALLYVFEDNEAVIKMIIKGRSPTMRHDSRSHKVALDWLFVRINLDSKIQIKHVDTKNQLADILTEGNFTRDEWNHLLCLFNISHLSSTVCSDTMAKRSQQDSGEERVTAKSRPMMNLIAKTPSFVSSSTSVSPWKKYYESQDPWKSVAGEDRSGRPGEGKDVFEVFDNHVHVQFMDSKLDYDRAWFSQEWKELRLRRAIDPDDLKKLLGEWYEKFDLTKKFFSTEPRNPKGTEEHFVIYQDDLTISILKKWQDLKI